MEDTESSDFLSSCDSIYSVGSTAVSGREDTNYVDFGVFLSGGLEEANKVEEDMDNVRMIPNSRLSSNDHPVLIRLENEYQARKSHWYQRSGRYFGQMQEIDGRLSFTSQNTVTSRGSPLGSKNEEKHLKHYISQDTNPGAPHGLKRQWKQEAELPKDWWKERKEQAYSASEGDRIFAQKCRELQGFIKPLTDLLNGLKKGRYERGLSTFQQSVAMDRIQRIIGVLQKPQMGERYLGTLLQVEMMLKIWFPTVTSSSSASSSSDCEKEEPHYKIAKLPKVDCLSARRCPLTELPSSNTDSEETPIQSPVLKQSHSDCLCKDRMHVLSEWPSMNLTWMHTAPIPNPSLSQADLHHLNMALEQEICGPHTNNCGVILFLHNNLVSSSPLPRPASTMQTEELPSVIRKNCREEVKRSELPLRSQSAPPMLPTIGSPRLGENGGHSCSLSHLPMCTQRPAGEKT
ncbi:circadian-associated transcriptional repressor [Pelobates fuscus]|uniref:circadian-associated transcriptional repressor n=1 Tax=Pelobates fuscus TaxID=191477 RepID=UPI002FE4A65C